MGNNWREIPKYAIKQQKKYAATHLEATNFPSVINFYDSVLTEGNGAAYQYEEDLAEVINTTSSTTEIIVGLSTTTIIPNSRVNARYISDEKFKKTDIYDASSLLYTERKPVFYSNTEIKKINRLIFATIDETIYSGDEGTNSEISRDIEIFVIENVEPQYDENGKFQYTKIVLKKIQRQLARRGTSSKTEEGITTTVDNYINITFTLGSIQPRNWKRRKITFTTKPILWEIAIVDEGDITRPWVFSDREKVKEEIHYQPFLPKLQNNYISFIPIWSNEIAWWNAFYDYANSNTSNLVRGKEEVYPYGSDNELEVSSAGTDTSPSMWNMSNTWYNGSYFQTSRISGDEDEKQDDLVDFMNDILTAESSPISTFNVMNYSAIDVDDSVSSTSLGRRENQASAVWYTRRYDSIFSYDMSSNLNPYVALYYSHQIFFSEASLTRDLDSNSTNFQFDINEYEENMVNNIQDLLQGRASILGESINERPPDVITSSFDTSGKAQNWDKDEIKKWLGWYPSSYRSSSWLLGSLENLLNAAWPDEFDLTQTSRKKYGAGNAAYTFPDGSNIKLRDTEYNFYSSNGEEWTLEIEVEDGIALNMTQFDIRYFGGYSYKIEDFQNTKAEAEENDGDVYCLDEQGNNLITYYVAENRKRPTRFLTSKVYASSSEATRILKEANVKLLATNSKWIYDLNNGKKIKNIQYKKGGK